MTREDARALLEYGLTYAQMRDCMLAKRNPKNGKRYRTSPPTPLELKCKKVNWARLQVKGAAIGMSQALREMVLKEGEALELEKTIRKLETLLLNKLAEGYEVTRFEYWQAQASKKK